MLSCVGRGAGRSAGGAGSDGGTGPGPEAVRGAGSVELSFGGCFARRFAGGAGFGPGAGRFEGTLEGGDEDISSKGAGFLASFCFRGAVSSCGSHFIFRVAQYTQADPPTCSRQALLPAHLLQGASLNLPLLVGGALFFSTCVSG